MKKMGKTIQYLFPQDYEREMSKLDDRLNFRLKGITFSALLMTTFGIGTKFIWKWGKLTHGKLIHYSLGYCFALQLLDYFLLDHAEDEVSLMLKFNKNY